MDNIPKPTPKFNQLIGEADYFMSIISLKIQTRINSFNPVADNTEIINRFPNIKNSLLENLKYTHGKYELIEKFEKTLLERRTLYGGYNHDKVKIILRKYKKIVKMRNSIAHSLPYDINGKYVKIHRSIDKNKIAKDVIVDEAFLTEFIEECNDLIEIFNNPDFNSIIQEFVIKIDKQLETLYSITSSFRLAVSKFNLALNMVPDNISDSVKTENSTKQISEKPTISCQHKQ